MLKITRESLRDGTVKAHQNKYFSSSHADMRGRTEAEMAALLEEVLARHEAGRDLWVFGYGSLIWNPAIEFVEQRPALLHGWHRRFCLKMYMGRGTPETPGVMLALDHGGACRGVAFRIAAKSVREELGLLWQREMYGGAYLARWVEVSGGEEKFCAVTFVVNRAHPRYLRELSVAQTAALIATGRGDLGTSLEYLDNTVAHLGQLGVRDAGLMRIVAALPKR
jgi:cation transport protein ChaC